LLLAGKIVSLDKFIWTWAKEQPILVPEKGTISLQEKGCIKKV
jgi:hypothetical protein